MESGIGQLAEPGISRVRSFALIVAVVNCIKNATKRSKLKGNQIFNTDYVILYWLIQNVGRKSQMSHVSSLELLYYYDLRFTNSDFLGHRDGR